MPYPKSRVPTCLQRSDFLQDRDVRRFIDHLLKPLLDEEQDFNHNYYHRQTRCHWACDSLLDAARNYFFRLPHCFRTLVPPTAVPHSLVANSAVLNHLGDRLRVAFRTGSNDAAVAASVDIQKWGGTDGLSSDSGNVTAIEALRQGFCRYLSTCERGFGNGQRFDFLEFDRLNTDVRSNAGFTKIYSLLFDNFVIYDSRVAAALGMLIVRHCRGEAVPSALRLVWMPGESHAVRNPNIVHETPAALLRMEGGKRGWRKHLFSNVRVNWMLADAIADTRFRTAVLADPAAFPVSPLRALEAGLFMIGYDLAGNAPYPPVNRPANP